MMTYRFYILGHRACAFEGQGIQPHCCETMDLFDASPETATLVRACMRVKSKSNGLS